MTHAHPAAPRSAPVPGSTPLTPGSATGRAFFWFTAVVAALLPLESFLHARIGALGAGEHALFALQFVIEASVYLALGTVLLIRLIGAGTWRRTPVDVPLMVVLAVVALSIAVNNAPLRGSLMNLRSALRYAAIFYLVVNLGLTLKQVRFLLWVVLISGLAQVGIGLTQWVVGYDLKVWMLPRQVDLAVAGKTRRFALLERGREIGSVFGTLGDTLYYGLFLLVVLGAALSRVRRWRIWDGLVLAGLLFGIALSFSRASVIAAGLTVLGFAAHRLGVRRVAAVCCASAAVGLVVLSVSLLSESTSGTYRHPRQGRRSVLNNMTSIFSAEYLERSKRQRLGTVLGVAPTAAMNAPLIGYGPAQGHAIEQLNQAHRTRLYKTLTKEGFEDVYWVALLCYTGIVGVVAVGWLGIRLAWTCAAIARGAGGAGGDPVLRWAGLAGLCVVAQAFVLMWFNRVPEIRSFSFYFWLLPALAYAAWSAHQASQVAADNDASMIHQAS